MINRSQLSKLMGVYFYQHFILYKVTCGQLDQTNNNLTDVLVFGSNPEGILNKEKTSCVYLCLTLFCSRNHFPVLEYIYFLYYVIVEV